MDDVQPILKVRSLNAWFGESQALKEVSVEIPPMAVTAVIGPSGCGKSTFIRCLNRLHEEVPKAGASGDVLLNGENIYGMDVDPVAIRRKIGMVFQKPNPFPALSVMDNVVVGLRLAGIRRRSILREVAERSLRQAALWGEVKDKLHKPGTSLSGGQQQRLCIARALAVDPPVLLMDEPCSALDPIATRRVEELMLELKNDYTIALVTHNMQQARRVADVTAFFSVDISKGGRTGHLVEIGETEQIFDAPKAQLTKEYIRGEFS